MTPTAIIPIICCFVIPLILYMVIRSYIPLTPLEFWHFLLDREYKREKKEYKEMISVLQERGVTAPADVISINTTGTKRQEPGWHFGTPTYQTEYEYQVNVFPKNGEPFKVNFFQFMGNIYDESGNFPSRILVLYDPNDRSKVIFHSFLKDETNERRAEFNKLADLNDYIRKVGEGAEAMITRVEDLDLDYPNRSGRAKRILLRVTPKSGASFSSETHAIIGYTATEKYSEGKKIFVKFIPDKLERVAFDSEKNKLIS